MALHTQLPIYRAAYGLLDVVTDLVKNMPRDLKRTIGEKISTECIEIMVLVFRANVASDKSPYLNDLLERQQVIDLLLRLSMDKHLISPKGYAKAVEITTSIGKQANKHHGCAFWVRAIGSDDGQQGDKLDRGRFGRRKSFDDAN